MINFIENKIKEATLSDDKVALKVYNEIKNSIHDFQYKDTIIPRRINDNIIRRIINRKYLKISNAYKQLSEAILQDLLSQYREQLEVLKKLIPEPVSAEELSYRLYIWADEHNFYGEQTLEDRMDIAIPKDRIRDAINFLQETFPTTDKQLIINTVKKYIK